MAYGYNNRDFEGMSWGFAILNFIVIAVLMGGIITIPLALVWIFFIAPRILKHWGK